MAWTPSPLRSCFRLFYYSEKCRFVMDYISTSKRYCSSQLPYSKKNAIKERYNKCKYG